MATHDWFQAEGVEKIEVRALRDFRGKLSALVTGRDEYGRLQYREEGYAQVGDTVLLDVGRAKVLVDSGVFSYELTPPAEVRATAHHDWAPASESQKVMLRALVDFRGKLSRITGQTSTMIGFPDAPLEGRAAAGDTVEVEAERVAAMLASGAFELVGEREHA